MTASQNSTRIELLTFRVGDQAYAVDITSVREIRGWTHATPLPHAPHYMKGVINLRGTVLPVMDLANRLDLAREDKNERAVIIVVNFEDSMTGLLVDAVSDIVAIPTDDLQPPPDASVNAVDNVVSALTLIDERMIRVLDLSATIRSSESAAA